jgi:hypothetical protein
VSAAVQTVRTGAIAALVALGIALGACSSKSSPPANTPTANAAKQVVDDLAAGDFSKVAVHFNSDMAAHYPVTQLASDWQTFQDKSGSYVSRGNVKEVVQGEVTTELIPIKLTKHQGQVQVSYHNDGSIVGLHFASK